MMTAENLLSKKGLIAAGGGPEAIILRFTVAAVIWPHGLQMVFGWFGGHGFDGTMDYFTDTIGLPPFMGLMVMMIQFLGPLFLFAGLMTRLVAFSIFVIVIGMVTSGGHFHNGFFMNWFGNRQGEGFEYHILLLGLCISLMIGGSGKCSVDSVLAGQK